MSSIEQVKRFLYIEGSENPLQRVSNSEILKNIIDPTTGHPYNGIVLEGEFASIGVLNNNNRLYSEENYIGFIENLKKQIHSKKGVYGELEHPKGYAIDYNNVSHKLLDIWYDKAKKKVFGIILLLNTDKGKIAQEIIKSGGSLGISARGGGAETKNPDGTISAILKLMVTFDIVYHPGFTTAILDTVNLNESDKSFNVYKPANLFIYEKDIEKLDSLYESYIHTPGNETNFFQWVSENKLFESEQEVVDEKNQDKLENNETNNQDEVQQDLGDAVDQQLSESQKVFITQMQNAQLSLGRKIKSASKQGKSFYDNSAGFVNTSQSDEDQ